jgi:hypothetical protein
MLTEEQIVALHVGMLLGFANFKSTDVGKNWIEMTKDGMTWRFVSDERGQFLTSNAGFSMARRGCGYFVDNQPCDRITFWNHLKTATVTSCDCPHCQ